jgi:hypothetical protein
MLRPLNIVASGFNKKSPVNKIPTLEVIDFLYLKSAPRALSTNCANQDKVFLKKAEAAATSPYTGKQCSKK